MKKIKPSQRISLRREYTIPAVPLKLRFSAPLRLYQALCLNAAGREILLAFAFAFPTRTGAVHVCPLPFRIAQRLSENFHTDDLRHSHYCNNITFFLICQQFFQKFLMPGQCRDEISILILKNIKIIIQINVKILQKAIDFVEKMCYIYI